MGKNRRQWFMRALIANSVIVAGTLSGCTGADNPKLADVPAVQPSAPTEPPKIPGQAKPFTKVDGYSKYMSKGGQGK